MKPCDHDSYPLYRRLIGPLRAKARELGYALAVHGSLKRDIDLVACPWTDAAVDAKVLAEAMRQVAAEHNGGLAHMTALEGASEWFQNGCQPFGKPHGRRCWCFHLGGGPYIDLSVMPKGEGEAVSEQELRALDEKLGGGQARLAAALALLAEVKRLRAHLLRCSELALAINPATGCRQVIWHVKEVLG